MKWDIWVEPNKIISEEYPDGWSTADVERAANNRYGGKVTTVSPSPIGGSSYSRSGGGSRPSFGALVWIGIGIAILGAIGGGDGDKSPAPAPQAPAIERSYTPSATADPSASRPSTYADGPCVTANFEPC